MPEQSKFSGVLAKLKQPPSRQPAERQAARPAPAIEAEPVRGKGRPPGKRSDPDYQPTTVLLRKQTKKTASRLLEDADTGQDLSDLIEQLLGEWIRQQS
jgi:hypothetical protein